jgi:RND family efflux transporter MFP subunit
MFAVRLASIGLLLLSSPIVFAEDDSSPPAEIPLTECRIKLIEQATLASDRAGILRFVECKEGDLVEADQQVAGLEDDLIAADLTAAEHKAKNDIPIRAAQKALELAQTEYDKARQANRDVKNTVPLIELQRLKLAAEKAALEIEFAEHEMVLSRLERDFKRAEMATYGIVAPYTGVVTKVYKQRGEAVRQGDPIVEITNADRLRVEGWVDLHQAWRVSLGDRVTVQLTVPEAELPIEERVFEGRVTFIDVAVEPVTRRTRIFAEVVNQDNLLRAGLTADMTIHINPAVERDGTATLSSRTVRRPTGSPAPRFQRTLRVPTRDEGK